MTTEYRTGQTTKDQHDCMMVKLFQNKNPKVFREKNEIKYQEMNEGK